MHIKYVIFLLFVGNSCFSAHQTHYEQLGFFRGKLRFPDLEGGEAYREVAVPSFRDHSFG